MSARVQRIDSLRGLAVFGILLINMYAFNFGNVSRYGFIDDSSGGLDAALIFVAAAFAEQKFYPIFAFLFGAGFALQTGAARPPGAELEAIRARQRRRTGWLLGCGILHGVLLFYGDILTLYALTAFWLARLAGTRLRDVLRRLRNVLWLNLVLVAISVGGLWAMMAQAAADIPAIIGATDAARAVYTDGGLLDIARLRLQDYLYNSGGGLLFTPHLALLFVLGVLAVRLGWLTRPQRRQAQWRRVLLWSLAIGLPLNLYWGYVCMRGALTPFAPAPLQELARFAVELAGPLLGAAYVAAVMLLRERSTAWLAPVGRMALTNYLMQSLLCVLLFQGIGLGLGAVLTRAQMLAVCGAIMLLQLLLSHWWLARRAQGPLEALWRRSYTVPK